MTVTKKKVGSYPYVNVLFSITSALFMIGLFSLFAIYAQKLTRLMQDSIEIQALLQKDLPEEEISIIKKEIESREYVNKDHPIRFVSKEEAAKDMISETGEDFVSFLGENPLRNAFLIYIKESFLDNDQMDIVTQDLESIHGVYEAIYTKSMVNEINRNIKRVGTIVGILAIIFLATVIILINNAIKLALFSQRFLIRSMQLVGATPFFIKKPFLMRGSMQGIFGGAIASCILATLLYFTSKTVPDFGALLEYRTSLFVFFGLSLLGGSIGYLSVYFSISRYLKMKLDDLY